jgi:hypothetical protein
MVFIALKFALLQCANVEPSAITSRAPGITSAWACTMLLGCAGDPLQVPQVQYMVMGKPSVGVQEEQKPCSQESAFVEQSIASLFVLIVAKSCANSASLEYCAT